MSNAPSQNVILNRLMADCQATRSAMIEIMQLNHMSQHPLDIWLNARRRISQRDFNAVGEICSESHYGILVDES